LAAAAPVISKHQIDVSQLPSVRDGSMTAQEEAIKRRKTCRFIEEVGRALKLPRVAIATAMVFFHRFYAKHSFNEQYVAGWWLDCNDVRHDGGEGNACFVCMLVHARCWR
jgi:Cyclin, N-terminal domain